MLVRHYWSSLLLKQFIAPYTLVTKLNSTQLSLLKVADTFTFVTDFGNISATTWIRQLVAVDFVADTFNFLADTVNFVASVYGAKATRWTFNKVDRVEFNSVASVYRVLHVIQRSITLYRILLRTLLMKWNLRKSYSGWLPIGLTDLPLSVILL